MSSCSQCGNPIPEGSRFCPECGALAPAQDTQTRNPTPAPQPPPAGFGSPTPPPASSTPPYQTTSPPMSNPPNMSTMTNPPLYSQQPMMQQPTQPLYTLAYDGTEPPPLGTPYSALTVKDVFIILLVFSIPAVGWILCIAWALGATKNRNKRSLARGYLLYILVMFLVSALLFAIAWWLFDLESVIRDNQYYYYYGMAEHIVHSLGH